MKKILEFDEKLQIDKHLCNGFLIIHIKQQQFEILLIHSFKLYTSEHKVTLLFSKNNNINITDSTNASNPGNCMSKYKKLNMYRVRRRDPWIVFYIPGLFVYEAKSFLSIVELNVTVDRELPMTRFFSDDSIFSVLCDWRVKPHPLQNQIQRPKYTTHNDK